MYTRGAFHNQAAPAILGQAVPAALGQAALQAASPGFVPSNQMDMNAAFSRGAAFPSQPPPNSQQGAEGFGLNSGT